MVGSEDCSGEQLAGAAADASDEDDLEEVWFDAREDFEGCGSSACQAAAARAAASVVERASAGQVAAAAAGRMVEADDSCACVGVC
jgi:hypothetical protein